MTILEVYRYHHQADMLDAAYLSMINDVDGWYRC